MIVVGGGERESRVRRSLRDPELKSPVAVIGEHEEMVGRARNQVLVAVVVEVDEERTARIVQQVDSRLRRSVA